MNKRAQGLLDFEWHFIWIGALIGIALVFVLIALTQRGIIPFTLPGIEFVCSIK